MEKFYITTAIYYVNSLPHIGSVSEAIAADIIARYKRLKGFDVLFSTGADEHSQKVEKRAKEDGIEPQTFADRASGIWKDIFEKFNISYSRFIRTSDQDHIKVVQDFFDSLYKKGDIYLGIYEGWYCVRDETFLKDSDLIEEKCPHCGGEVQRISEDNYFFRLSKYRDLLLKHYEENKDFLQPESRYNEILNIIKSGLQDVSVTRKSFKFGIPVPFDDEHIVYVWFDALINYITAAGMLEDKEKFSKYWPADLHLVGKDITRFHGIVWPAMLLSYGLPLPRQIFAHGFWNLEGAKMSKSLGNVVDPVVFAEKFSKFAQINFDTSVDVLRYYLSREVNFGLDGDFRMETFFARFNFDLANDYGNLINRTVSMLYKYSSGIVGKEKVRNSELISYLKERVDKYFEEMDQYHFSFALDSVWEIISYLNNYVQVKAPWTLTRKRDELDSILYELLEGIRIVTIMLQPFMPYASKIVLENIVTDGNEYGDFDWGFLKAGTKVNKIAPIFPRIDKDKLELETQNEIEEAENVIKYDDFVKIELRVAEVLEAERVESSDKLIKLSVSLGKSTRTIVAGIGKCYSPEELLHKKIIVVINLEPRKLMGIESHGMLLAASNDEKLVLLTVDSDVEAGSKIS